MTRRSIVGEQLQPTVNDHAERIEQLERELSLARAQLASETAARCALEDQLRSAHAIVEQNKQEQSTTARAEETPRPTARRAALGNRRGVSPDKCQSASPSAISQQRLGSQRGSGPPTVDELDLSDPARAIEALRSFDHAGYLQTIAKTIRKWQKHAKRYREQAKSKISFRDFAVGDLALFLPTRNSPLRPWAAFNGAWSSSSCKAVGCC